VKIYKTMVEPASGAYLGNEPSINENIAVGTSSVEISRPKNRVSYTIRNVSTAGQVISLVLSNTRVAVASTGIVLNPNETFVDSTSEGYKAWTGSIRAISDAASGAVAIMERI